MQNEGRNSLSLPTHLMHDKGSFNREAAERELSLVGEYEINPSVDEAIFEVELPNDTFVTDNRLATPKFFRTLPNGEKQILDLQKIVNRPTEK